MKDLYDFNTAERSSFDTIPDKTTAPVIVLKAEDRIADSGANMLNFTLAITDGPFKKRQFFHSFFLGYDDDRELSEGQVKGINMSREKIRSIVEAARHIAPTDESSAAIAARRLRDVQEFVSMEFECIIGVEKGTGQYADKNVIARVVPYKTGAAKFAEDSASANRPRVSPAYAETKPTSPKNKWG